MNGKLNHAISATRAIADLAGAADEVFLMTFGDRPEMRVGLTRGAGPIAHGLTGVQAYGDTALIDAIYQALHEVRASSHRRRALAVISDGGDNASRYSQAELKRLALEADVQIYGISIVEKATDRDQRRGAFLLEELAEITGGLHFTIRHRADLAADGGQAGSRDEGCVHDCLQAGRRSARQVAQDPDFGNATHA